MPSYRDYLWTKDTIPDEYLVSLIRDSTSDEVLTALNAFNRRPHGTGFSGFARRAQEFWYLDLIDPMALCAQTVGVADIGGGWVLMVQHASDYVGVTDELMRPIIDGHEVVSHFSNVNADSQFVWWRNGERQISFDTLGPEWDLEAAAKNPTAGSPTALALIDEVGGIESDYDGTRTEFFHVQGAFALAEGLTGVTLTQELLETADFTVALVPTVPESRCRVAHDIPPREPQLGASATWSDIERLYRSAAETTVHGEFRQTQNADDVEQVELWHHPSGAYRQEDEQGLFAVQDPRQRLWYRGPYSPQVDPFTFVRVHRRWHQTAITDLVPATTPGTPVTVAGRRAWEFELPPPVHEPRIAIAFDAETGVVLRVETPYMTQEFLSIAVGEEFEESLFVVPDEQS